MLTYTSRTPTDADIEAIFRLFSSAYPFAPVAIAYVKSKGYYCAGFSPRITKDGQLTFAAYMAKIPEEELDKDKIKVIPAVKPLFDFVWQQYEASRK